MFMSLAVLKGETFGMASSNREMINLFDTLFLVAIFLAVLYLYLSWNFNYWKKRGIPSDDKLSIIFGSMSDVILGKIHFGKVFSRLYDSYPEHKVVGWFKFHNPGIMIRDPELVHRLLVTDFNSFRNNDFQVNPEVDPIMGNNIFVLKDEMWKKSRALITPAFTAGKIKAIYPVMKKVANELVEYLKNHPEEHHTKSLMSRYTSEIVAQCAFGVEGKNFEEPKPTIHELGKMLFEPTTMRNLKLVSFMLFPKLAKLLKVKVVSSEIIDFFNSILNDVIIHRQKNNIERNDLIQYLIEVKRKALEVAKGNIQSDVITKVYSDNDILSGCIMFFVEGYETSALVLNNILYQLALHKDVQDTLRHEIDDTLSEGELTFEKLHEMNYLSSIYLETNRLLPVLYSLQKICTERYTMDLGKEKSLVIESGTPVAIPLFKIHNDPMYWDEPEKFKPERFMNKEEQTARTKGIYMPFGDGPRMCPGSRIATTLVKVAIVQIIANLEVIPTSRTPKKIDPDPKYFMVGHKGGIFLKFIERSR